LRTRVLVAIEEEYRSYREVIAASVSLLRPHVEVMSTGLEALEQKVADFAPQLVVSSQSRATIRPPPIAWVRVSTGEPTMTTEIWLREERWEDTGPKAILLAGIIDGIEEKLAPTEDPNDTSPRERSGSGTRRPVRPVPDTESDDPPSPLFSPHLFEERSLGIP
jgi:hypothetical protein